jgi:hypothetical protein
MGPEAHGGITARWGVPECPVFVKGRRKNSLRNEIQASLHFSAHQYKIQQKLSFDWPSLRHIIPSLSMKSLFQIRVRKKKATISLLGADHQVISSRLLMISPHSTHAELAYCQMEARAILDHQATRILSRQVSFLRLVLLDPIQLCGARISFSDTTRHQSNTAPPAPDHQSLLQRWLQCYRVTAALPVRSLGQY